MRKGMHLLQNMKGWQKLNLLCELKYPEHCVCFALTVKTEVGEKILLVISSILYGV